MILTDTDIVRTPAYFKHLFLQLFCMEQIQNDGFMEHFDIDCRLLWRLILFLLSQGHL